MFQGVYQVGFLPVCKGTFQEECPVACPAAWGEGCLGDQADLCLNSFHPTRVQGQALCPCRGSLINLIPHIKAIRRFNRPDHKGWPLRSEWDIRVQPQRNPCWLIRTGIWKPSNGGMLKKGNREREVA